MKSSISRWVNGLVLCSLLAAAFAPSAIAASETAASRLSKVEFNPIHSTLAARVDGTSISEADRRLRIQALQGFIAPDLHKQLGQNFGGLVYDRSEARWSIGVTTSAAASTASTWLKAEGVNQYVDIKMVTRSYDLLSNRQQQIEPTIKRLTKPGDIQVSVDIAKNELLVLLADDLDTDAPIVDELKKLDVPVTFARAPRDELAVHSLACAYPHCDRPLRGGVAIATLGTSFQPTGSCTAGFMAVQPSDYSVKYLITAGHCVKGQSQNRWKAKMPTWGEREIGYVGQWFMDGRGDAARIRVQNTSASPNWYTAALAGRTAAWGNNEELKVGGWVGNPAQGSFYCRYGQMTSVSCGNVQSPGPSCNWVDGIWVCNMWYGSSSSVRGDSGGPGTGYGNIAYGTLTGVAGCCQSWFTNVDAIQNNLGAWIIWES